jgi:predicted O-methyltransferase YrrM
MELVYKKDEFNNNILCDNEYKHQIMMEWEKPYMEKSIELLSPFGKVLEIGFGLGYSASKICSFQEVYEYNVIECSPVVWKKFEEFKQELKNIRPDLIIKLIKGRWEDVLIETEIYDCIYMDDYCLDETMIDYTNIRANKFLYKVLKKHTKIGSKIGLYSTVNCITLYSNIKCISIECNEYKISIPKNCDYAKGDKMFIPILTKIAETDIDLHEKLFKQKNVKNDKINNQIFVEIERQKKYKKLFDDINTRNPSCSLIIIDNFYKNAYDTRKFILTQEFTVRGNYPGQRTISFANEELKKIIQKYVEPFGGKITHFPMPKEDGSDAHGIYNGSFQYATSRDRSWVHIDGYDNWAGVLYLTPNAPISSGTSFYKFKDGTTCKKDIDILKNKEETDKWSQDLTKWSEIDKVGNIFNRLILFNSNNFHMSRDYFGDTKENSRLFQVFFFSTEY